MLSCLEDTLLPKKRRCLEGLFCWQKRKEGKTDHYKRSHGCLWSSSLPLFSTLQEQRRGEGERVVVVRMILGLAALVCLRQRLPVLLISAYFTPWSLSRVRFPVEPLSSDPLRQSISSQKTAFAKERRGHGPPTVYELISCWCGIDRVHGSL